jgi:hypothetical protein
VENLAAAVSKKEIDPTKLVIFLNGQPLKGEGVFGTPVKGVSTIITSPNVDLVAFDLQRTDESREKWAALLGSPSWSNPFREVSVSVGPADKEPLPSSKDKNPKIWLRLFDRSWLVWTSLGVMLALVVFGYLAKSTDILRDSNPPQPGEGKKRPYSLALTQAAVWFFLVIGSFLFIRLVTGDINSITEQALILMGIGTGTALGAAMIDSTKRGTADAALSTLEPKKAQLEEEAKQLDAKVKSLAGATTTEDKQAFADASVKLKETEAKVLDTIADIDEAKSGLSKPVSEGFFRDLLTDANGVNLHRFQMLIWTVVLGFLFVIGVYKALAMPAFSTTLLALMGISSGTYLGFKIPEKQS